MKKNTLVKKFEEIIEKIESLTFMNGIEAWKVTRTTLKTGTREFTTYALKMEVADDYLILSDIQDTLMNNELSLFILDNVKEIKVIEDKKANNILKLDIIMNDLYLTIEPISDLQIPDEIYEAALSN
jgi:hypothetical protein